MPDDAPDYLRGKNAAEIIDWTNRLVTEVQQVVANAQPAPPQRQEIMQPTQTLPNADEALTDPAGYQQKMANYFAAQTAQQIAAVAQPFAAQLADTARTLSKSNAENAEVWNKYGSEVDSMVQNIPSHLRTQALYDNAVVMVRGRHWKDFASEQATRLAAAGTSVERSTAGSDAGDEPSGNGDTWSKIEGSSIGAATIAAIGKRGIMRNINKGVYKSLEAYAEAVTKSKSRTEAKQSQVIRG